MFYIIHNDVMPLLFPDIPFSLGLVQGLITFLTCKTFDDHSRIKENTVKMFVTANIKNIT